MVISIRSLRRRRLWPHCTSHQREMRLTRLRRVERPTADFPGTCGGMSARTSFAACSRPSRRGRDFHVQTARNPLSLPGNHGGRLDDHQDIAPFGPMFGQQHPEPAVELTQPRAWRLPFQYNQLPAHRQAGVDPRVFTLFRTRNAVSRVRTVSVNSVAVSGLECPGVVGQLRRWQRDQGKRLPTEANWEVPPGHMALRWTSPVLICWLGAPTIHVRRRRAMRRARSK